MLQNHLEIKKEEKILLSSLTFEVDNIFFNLRKACKTIRRELNLLNQENFVLPKKNPLPTLNEENLKKLIDQMQPHHFLGDEYIIYMLKNENNNIFKLIKEYNEYLEKRKYEQEDDNYLGLRGVDEKLAYCIQRLGAMIYHFNIHLNLLNVLLRNASSGTETQQAAFKVPGELH
jgi:hypothetical protein